MLFYQPQSLYISILVGVITKALAFSPILYGPRHAKMCLQICASAKYHSGLCSSFIHSVVSNYPDSGQQKPRSDCPDAQSDLGLCCPHMLKGMFLLGAAHIIKLLWHTENILHTHVNIIFCFISSFLLH